MMNPLDYLNPMVGFGEDVAQPGRGQPADAQPSPVAVGTNYLIQHFRDAHPPLLMQKLRHIVYPFVANLSLLTNPLYSATVAEVYLNFTFHAKNERTIRQLLNVCKTYCKSRVTPLFFAPPV
jgi:hypothetical protein